MKSALIIFARNPIEGMVKTRIAKQLGNEAALNIYTKLLGHTHSITFDLDVDRFVFYADFINNEDLWNMAVYKKRLQHGDDLGQRMINAFEELFSEGYAKVAIIGSDCFDLNKKIIEQAFNTLDDHNFVIGPSEDGGYYLIGMNTFTPHVFEKKQWSTETVFSETINDIKTSGYTYGTLPTLSDVDTAEDYKKYSSFLTLSS